MILVIMFQVGGRSCHAVWGARCPRWEHACVWRRPWRAARPSGRTMERTGRGRGEDRRSHARRGLVSPHVSHTRRVASRVSGAAAGAAQAALEPVRATPTIASECARAKPNDESQPHRTWHSWRGAMRLVLVAALRGFGRTIAHDVWRMLSPPTFPTYSSSSPA